MLVVDGGSETTSLIAQHYLWKHTLNYNLHPDVPIPTYNARIADVATGNGSVNPSRIYSLLTRIVVYGFSIYSLTFLQRHNLMASISV